MEYVTSGDGTAIAYHRSGSGPPLVLVHGTSADHTRWSRVAGELSLHHEVYALDRRGRGSSGEAAAYALACEAHDVAALLARIGQPADLFGHSFGAICSLEASLLAGNVRRLILYELYEPPLPLGEPLYPPGLVSRLQLLIDGGDSEAALLTFFREVVHVPKWELDVMRAQPAWPARVSAARTIPRELKVEEVYRFEPDRFRGFETPCLLLLGGESPPALTNATRALHAALPHSRIAILPGQRHVAMDTALELFLQEVRHFLTP